MKGKLKLIILSMLALLLVACGSATPSPNSGGTGTGSEITPKPDGGTETGGGTTPTPSPGGGTGTGGGTTPKEAVILKEWQSIDGKIKSEVKEAQGKAERDPLKANYDPAQESFYILGDAIVEYDETKIKNIHTGIVPDPAKIELHLFPNSHLEFKGNVGEIKFKRIENNGNMYFLDKLDRPKEYVVSIDKEDATSTNFFVNRGNIYVMDDNGGITLKIDGEYSSYYESKGNIHLGLYVSKDGKEFSTDKVYITGSTQLQTKVHFIYNEGQVNGLQENAQYHGEDYVIKVDGTVHTYEAVKHTRDAFIMEGNSIPVGLNSYKLKFEHEGSEDPDTEGHIWKLKLEKK